MWHFYHFKTNAFIDMTWLVPKDKLVKLFLLALFTTEGTEGQGGWGTHYRSHSQQTQDPKDQKEPFGSQSLGLLYIPYGGKSQILSLKIS